MNSNLTGKLPNSKVPDEWNLLILAKQQEQPKHVKCKAAIKGIIE